MQFIAQKWSDNSLVSSDNPAHPDDILILYGTGFGATTPTISDGNNAYALLPNYAYVASPVKAQVEFMVNGIAVWEKAETLYCVASPQYVGVTQCAIQIPTTQPDSGTSSANLQLSIGAASTGSLSFAFAAK